MPGRKKNASPVPRDRKKTTKIRKDDEKRPVFARRPAKDRKKRAFPRHGGTTTCGQGHGEKNAAGSEKAVMRGP